MKKKDDIRKHLMFLATHPYKLLYYNDFIFWTISKKRKHVWIIAAPKSGSTWISAIFQELLKWKTSHLVNGYGRREQEIDIRKLISVTSRDNLFSPHQHCRASETTIKIIERARIQPIIHIRNIFDIVISVRDSLDQGNHTSAMAFVDANWHNMPYEKRTDFIIDMVVPWYFNFFAGWFSSELVRNKKAYISTYENMHLGQLIL